MKEDYQETWILGQVSLSVLGWLFQLSTRLAGAALTLAANTVTTPGDRRGGRPRDDISQSGGVQGSRFVFLG